MFINMQIIPSNKINSSAFLTLAIEIILLNHKKKILNSQVIKDYEELFAFGTIIFLFLKPK